MSNSVYRFLYDIETAIISKKEYECFHKEGRVYKKEYSKDSIEVDKAKKVLSSGGRIIVQAYTFIDDSERALNIIRRYIEDEIADIKTKMDDAEKMYSAFADMLNLYKKSKIFINHYSERPGLRNLDVVD